MIKRKKRARVDWNRFLKDAEYETSIPFGMGSNDYLARHFRSISIRKYEEELSRRIKRSKSSIEEFEKHLKVYDQQYTWLYRNRQELIHKLETAKCDIKRYKKAINLIEPLKRKVAYIKRTKVKYKELDWVHNDKYGVGMVRGFKINFNKNEVNYYRVAFKRGKKNYYVFMRENEIGPSEAGDLLFGKATFE